VDGTRGLVFRALFLTMAGVRGVDARCGGWEREAAPERFWSDQGRVVTVDAFCRYGEEDRNVCRDFMYIVVKVEGVTLRYILRKSSKDRVLRVRMMEGGGSD
jgi:hypothetical protein